MIDKKKIREDEFLMGMFDCICGNVKCPNCNTIFEFNEQVKWTNDPTLTSYKSGEYIDADDGEYDYATYIRPDLVGTCPECNKMWNIKAVVKDHEFLDLVAFKEYMPIPTDYGDLYVDYLYKRQKEIDDGILLKMDKMNF